MPLDTTKLTLNDDDKLPFERYMFDVLNIWFEDKVHDPAALGARARALLARYRAPVCPEGVTPAEHAKALVRRTDENDSNTDAKISFVWLMDAITVWLDCAEAYIWISNIVEGRDQAPVLMQPFYSIAIDALNRRIAEKGLTLESPELRAEEEFDLYLTASRGLGEALATHNDLTRAAELYQTALRMDPDDSHEILPRFALVKALLKDNAAVDGALVYCQENALTKFVTAVVLYGRDGDSPAARKALYQARIANPHVVAFIAKTRRWIGTLTGDSKPGGVDEGQFITLALMPAFPVFVGLERWFRKEAGVVSKPPPGRGSSGRKRR